MLNVECLMLNEMPTHAKRGAFNIQHSTFNIPVLLAFSAMLIAASISANELSVDKRTMQLDDTVTITVMLEDAFASIDSVRVPLRNLVIEGEPSVSSEFDFINGRKETVKVRVEQPAGKQAKEQKASSRVETLVDEIGLFRNPPRSSHGCGRTVRPAPRF